MDIQGSAANYHVLSIIEACARLGIERTALIAQASMENASFDQPYQRQPAEKVLKLWHHAEKLTRNRLIPFYVGAKGSTLHRSAVTSMIEACATLGEALELGVRYQHITQNIIRSELLYKDQNAYMRIDHCIQDLALVRPQIERQLAFVIAEALNLVQGHSERFPGVELHFSYQPRAPINEYEQLTGFPVKFGSTHNQLIFPKSVLEFGNFCFSKEVKSSLLNIVRQQDQAMHKVNNTAEQLRQAISDQLGLQTIDIESIALILGMSVRTLQRRLKEQNTNFSEVYDTERERKAFELLSQNALSLSEISFRLGFSHITGFYNAFQRWTGTTPKLYRQTQIAQ